MSGPRALCVGPRRSLCQAPAFPLCVGAGRSLCRGPGALCVRARRSLCPGLRSLSGPAGSAAAQLRSACFSACHSSGLRAPNSDPRGTHLLSQIREPRVRSAGPSSDPRAVPPSPLRATHPAPASPDPRATYALRRPPSGPRAQLRSAYHPHPARRVSFFQQSLTVWGKANQNEIKKPF